MRETHAEIQRQPRGRLVLVFQKHCVGIGPMVFLLVQHGAAGIRGKSEEGVVVLAPGFHAHARVMPLLLGL